MKKHLIVIGIIVLVVGVSGFFSISAFKDPCLMLWENLRFKMLDEPTQGIVKPFSDEDVKQILEFRSRACEQTLYEWLPANHPDWYIFRELGY